MTIKTSSSPPQTNDQDNNHNYQCHCYKGANDPSYNPSSTTTSWGEGVSTIYKEEHVMSFVLYTLNCHHMHYSLVGLGVSVWEVVWEVVESEPWDEKIDE